MQEAVAGADVIVHAVPAQHTAAFIEQHAALFPAGVPLVSTVKHRKDAETKAARFQHSPSLLAGQRD